MTILDNFKKMFNKEDYTFEVMTSIPGVYDYGNVDLAKKLLPQWFKDLPPTISAEFTYPPSHPFKDHKISSNPKKFFKTLDLFSSLYISLSSFLLLQ